MVHITAVLEDTVLVAAWTPDRNWQVTIADNVTGISFQKPATDDEFKALLTLAIGFCEDPKWDHVAPALYTIVEPWLEGTPLECRPIP